MKACLDFIKVEVHIYSKNDLVFEYIFSVVSIM